MAEDTRFKAAQVERIAIFLRKKRGFWCNSCVQAALGFQYSKGIDHLTRKLATARKYYEQVESVHCSKCEELKKCIRFVA